MKWKVCRLFGCAAFTHQFVGKLNFRALKVSSLIIVKEYRLWLREIKGFKIIISRNVVFNEYDLPCLKIDKTPESTNQITDEERGIEIEVEHIKGETDEFHHQTGAKNNFKNNEISKDGASIDEYENDLKTNQPLNDY